MIIKAGKYTIDTLPFKGYEINMSLCFITFLVSDDLADRPLQMQLCFDSKKATMTCFRSLLDAIDLGKECVDFTGWDCWWNEEAYRHLMDKAEMYYV